MKKFFLFAIVLSSILGLHLAYASDKKGGDSASCVTGCGHEFAPGVGTGQSVCWLTFIAEPGYTDFEAQILSPGGQGLLRNKKGEIAIRGGKDTTRISVDCSAVRLGERMIMCFIHEGEKVTRTIKGGKFKNFLPANHVRGGFEIQL